MRDVGKLTLACLVLWAAVEAGAGRAKTLLEVFQSSPTLERAARDIYARITSMVEPVKVRFPAESAADAVVSSIRGGVQAVAVGAASAVAASRASALFVEPSQADATVQIMNIGPRYQPGMSLPPGDYEIQVQKDGFRTKRFWVSTKGSTGGEVRLRVDLKPLGLPDCEDNVMLSNYAALPFSGDSSIAQVQALFAGSDINDLYLSFAKMVDEANYLRAYRTIVSPAYVEVDFLQPSHLSGADVSSNRNVRIDPDRFVFNKAVFETRGDDVFVTHQSFLPNGVLYRGFDEKVACDYVFNY